MISVRLVASLLLVGLSFVICSNVEDTPSLVPMFLWSKNNYFGESHNTVSESLQPSDVQSLISNLISHKSQQKSKITSYLNKAQTPPEILVAFIYPQLSSADASRIAGGYSSSSSSSSSPSFLQTALKESGSSLSLPFILTSSSLRNDLIDVVSVNSPNSVLLASNDIDATDKSLTGCDALLNHLHEDQAIFSNGITDLLLIPYDHTKDSGNCMDRLLGHVNEKTSGKFVSLVSSEHSAQRPIQMVFFDGTESPHFEKSSQLFTEFAIDQRPSSGKFQVAATSGYLPIVLVGVQYATPTTIVALFLAFFMVAVIYTGATCVMYIETPVRYSNVNLQLAKEY